MSTFETVQGTYKAIRSSIHGGNDDTALTTATHNWASKPAATACIEIPDYANYCELIMMVENDTDPDGADAGDLTAYMYRDGGPAQRVFSAVDMLGGDAQVIENPCLGVTLQAFDAGDASWIDDITTFTNTWSPAATLSEDASDRIASIRFDCCGYRWLFPQLTDVAAATYVSVFGAFW